MCWFCSADRTLKSRWWDSSQGQHHTCCFHLSYWPPPQTNAAFSANLWHFHAGCNMTFLYYYYYYLQIHKTIQTESWKWSFPVLLRAWIGKGSCYQSDGSFVTPLTTGSDSLSAVERKPRSGEAAFWNECQGKTREGKHSKGYGFPEHRETKAEKVSEELCLCEKTGPLIFRIKLQMKTSVTRDQLSRTVCPIIGHTESVPTFLYFDTKFTFPAPLHRRGSAFLPFKLTPPCRTWSFLMWQLSCTWGGRVPGERSMSWVLTPSLFLQNHSELIYPKL